MHVEVVQPNVKNFIKSLRDIGYSFEIAVADIIDNSITAKARNIFLNAQQEPSLIFSILDDGFGMNESELIEAMRLSSKDPDDNRNSDDLGKFGLGLKTASFSQCKKLTVISKKENRIFAKRWDLDYISTRNEWYLITPPIQEVENYYFYQELLAMESGTIIIWEDIDRYPKNEFIDIIFNLRNHLSLVFHRFIESNKLKIYINNGELEPFNPFNPNNLSTQQISPEKILFFGNEIKIQPYILPHHSKLTQLEYDRYATEEGYIKSQGFYLYRANRLLVYGTWWGLHKANDAHKLVRIQIDISNTQDKYWGIDVKKSMARPHHTIKNDLKRIISVITPKSSKIYTNRGNIIEDKIITRFWKLISINGNFKFSINNEHPLLDQLKNALSSDNLDLLNFYLKSLEEYLPLTAIQAHLQDNPLKVKQESILDDDVIKVVELLKKNGISEDYIQCLLKTEVFKNKKELFL